ncbi:MULTISPECIES: hypothetical protein [unclassified Bradyrhizobium]|uniref:hypothetical protein n=1 Tax=unclassified Bradyrhizobium TaxID=2631580 RepID=UPI003393CB8F
MPSIAIKAGVAGALLANLSSFWLSTARYNTGDQLPAVIADFRRNLYSVPQLGPEIVVNGAFATDVSGWTQGANTSFVWNGANNVTLTNTSANNASASQSFNTVPGKLYKVSVNRIAASSATGAFQANSNTGVFVSSGTTRVAWSANGVNAAYFLSTSTVVSIQVDNNSNTSAGFTTFGAISVQEVMLGDVGAELINNANWSMSVNGGTGTATNAPSGTLNLTGDGTNNASADQSFATVVGQAYTLSENITIGAGSVTLAIGTTQGGVDVVAAVNVTAVSGQFFQSFIAKSTTTWVRFYKTSVGTSSASNISLRSWTARPTLRSATFSDVYSFTASGTTSRTYKDSSGVTKNDLVAHQPRYTFENGVRQLALNNSVASKSTNKNANPTATTNVAKTGDAAATLTIVDDSAALTAAGLSNICTSGKVYKLDNSAGSTTAQASFSGQTSNLNIHALSAYVRGSGAINLRTGFCAPTGMARTVTTNYVRQSVTLASLTAGALNTADVMWIEATAGSVVYFILNQFEDNTFAGPVIPNDTLSPVTRAVETCEHSPLVEAIIQRAQLTTIVHAQTSQAIQDNNLLGLVGAQWLVGGHTDKTSRGWNGTTAVVSPVGATDMRTPFGASLAGDASGSQAGYLGAVGSNIAASPIGSFNRSNSYLARNSINYSYGDGFYDEEVIYASRLTSAQLQAQSVAYA